MPLPSPNLDDRTYRQLVDEALGAISQSKEKPLWTDYNPHDPGITFIELFAWLSEMQQYYQNRDRRQSTLKFLKLLGSPPRDASPAQCLLTFSFRPSAGQEAVFIPSGTPLGAGAVPFETQSPLLALRQQVERVLSAFAEGVQDYSEANRALGLSFPAFGETARPGSRLYVGFQSPLPIEEALRLTFELVEDYPVPRNPDPAPPEELLPQARIEWEFSSRQGWSVLEVLQDSTWQLSRSGALVLRSPAKGAAPQQRRIPPFDGEAFWLRATLRESGYEVAPRVRRVLLNTVPAAQQDTWSEAFEFSSSGDGRLFQAAGHLALHGDRRVQVMEEEGLWRDWAPTEDLGQSGPQDRHYSVEASPRALTLRFGDGKHGRLPPAPGDLGLPAGSSNIRLIAFQPGFGERLELGAGNGFPSQRFALPAPQAAQQSVRVQVAEKSDGDSPLWSDWLQVDDFDSSSRFDRHFRLDFDKGEIEFGNGIRGAVPPALPGLESTVRLFAYRVSWGEQGNLPAGAIDTPPPHLIDLNVTNSRPSSGGSGPETLEAAGKRVRRELKRPWRAVTSQDFETLALATPGLRVARAKALPLQAPAPQPPGLMPAPASVTVVVAPFSLLLRPVPSPNFLQGVSRHLQLRRLITTRVYVIAPLYSRLRVEAQVRMLPGFDAREVEGRIEQALDSFYHPLTGGAQGKGWPFGRPLYKSEAYQHIDQVEGVDCVERLDLAAGGAGVSRDSRGNVLLPPQGLVYTGRHSIEVLEP